MIMDNIRYSRYRSFSPKRPYFLKIFQIIWHKSIKLVNNLANGFMSDIIWDREENVTFWETLTSYISETNDFRTSIKT